MVDSAKGIDGRNVESSPSSAPSLDDLYRRHRDWLSTLARRRLRLQPADADDIVQDAYLRLAQKEPADVRRPKALLSQIALNLFRDNRRRRAVREAYSKGQGLDPQAPTDSRALADQEARLAMEQIVLALPDAQRDVFVLSRFRHMTNREIAEHLGVSIKTVEWRMSRALDFCIGSLRD